MTGNVRGAGAFEACTRYRDHCTDDRNITLTVTGVGQDLEALGQRAWVRARPLSRGKRTPDVIAECMSNCDNDSQSHETV
jgi:hypothetical protein